MEANDEELRSAAIANAQTIGAGHIFVLLIRQAYPINLLSRARDCFEVCTIYCATANPVEVMVAQTKQGRGILGVIDGSSPKGVEGPRGPALPARIPAQDWVQAVGVSPDALPGGRTAALPCQIKIADFVVGGSAVPHPALRIAEEFADGGLGMRERILDDVSRSRIEASDQVHVVRVVPKITVGIETQAVGTRIRARQRKFLEGLRLRDRTGPFFRREIRRNKSCRRGRFPCAEDKRSAWAGSTG